jgi:hypothetical protein
MGYVDLTCLIKSSHAKHIDMHNVCATLIYLRTIKHLKHCHLGTRWITVCMDATILGFVFTSIW